MPSSKAPAYQRGKYNVKRKSPKTTCPICNKVVFSRGLNSHIKIGHSGVSVNEIIAKNSSIKSPEPTKLSEGGNTESLLRSQIIETIGLYSKEEYNAILDDIHDYRQKLLRSNQQEQTLFNFVYQSRDINNRRIKE